MKVCKKCKTHVANKAKICKKCGADVSKAKIIKTTNNKNTSKSKNTKTQIKQKITPLVEPKSKQKDQVVVTTKQSKNQTQIKEAKSKSEDQVVITTKTDSKNKNNTKTKNKKEQISKTKKILFKSLNTTKIGSKKTFNILKAVFIYLSTEMYQSIKTTAIILLDIIKAVGKSMVEVFSKKVPAQIKKIHTKRQMIRENKPKKNKEEKYVTYKLEDYSSQTKKPKEPGKKKPLKFAIISIFIISVAAGLYFVGRDIYKDLVGPTNKVIVTEKATTEKVFSMEDIITYNNVDYKVVKIETSKGNSYKSPKAGHQFLIVTVYIKNNAENKIPYSYENWTMSNSKGEEKKRIFSSINVDSALYSGELVVGGIKTGSMVFEQPINDPKLKMNFYELKKDDDGNEVIDEAKRVFSISVKVPNQKIKKVKENKKSEDVKVVKTNTKDKS